MLVAVAVLGVAMTGLSTMMANSAQLQKMVQQRQSVTSTQLNMVGVLSYRSVCEANFKDVEVNTPITQIQSSTAGPPEIVLQAGATYTEHALRVTSMSLGNFRPYASAGPDLFRGTMDLVINFQGSGTGVTGTSATRQVLLAVELNGYPPASPGAPQGIRTCVSVGNDFNNVWRLKPNGDVFYEAFNVGIGTTSPVQKLHVAGPMLATTYLHESDERLKDNIEILDGIGDIAKLRGVRFKWKKSGKKSFGLIAQDVEKVYPEAVSTDPKSGIKMVAYDQLVAPLIEANKALLNRVQGLERKVEDLQKTLANP